MGRVLHIFYDLNLIDHC